MNFQGALAKLTIGSLEREGGALAVEAHYNPKELQIDKPVPWLEHAEMNLEYQGIKSRTFSLELLLDGFERGKSIRPVVEKLETLSSPRVAGSKLYVERRPHRCVVVWGDRGMPRVRCVIEELSVKYMMWDANGTPLRAICTVKLKECAVDATEARNERREQDRAARRARERRYVGQPGIVRVS